MGQSHDAVVGFNARQPVVLFHCASLGEYEQGRPMIDAFKDKCTDYQVVISFFSPSGYDVVKAQNVQETIVYLPIDIKRNVIEFLDKINPSIIFLVKYEFWPNLLTEAKLRNIQTVCFAANFRAEQAYFNYRFLRNLLLKVDVFYVQNETSKFLLKNIGHQRVIICTDPRFERVKTRKQRNFRDKKIVDFVEKHQVLILGSVYASDAVNVPDEVFLKQNNLKALVFPHEMGEQNVAFWQKYFPDAVRYSDQLMPQSNALIVDKIGLLADAYSLANFAYVGGFSEKGIHNVLEAAVYGINVWIGCGEHKKFAEVLDLQALGVLSTVENHLDTAAQIKHLLENPDEVKKTSEICKEYFESKPSAAAQIIDTFNLKTKLSE